MLGGWNGLTLEWIAVCVGLGRAELGTGEADRSPFHIGFNEHVGMVKGKAFGDTLASGIIAN